MQVETKQVELEYGLFGTQYDFVMSRASFPAFIGGRGSGKTRGGAIKLLGLLGEQQTSALVTAPTFPMLRDATLKTCLELWPQTAIADYSKTEMMIKLTNGSEVRFRSTDDPDHLRGPNIGVVWMDEPAQSTLEAWQILLGTLRLPPMIAFLTGTPRGYTWIYQEWVVKQRPEYVLFKGSSRQNPHLPPAYIKSLEDSYAADFALQEIEGEFVIVSGGCYFDTTRLKELLGSTKQGEVFKPYVVGRRYAAAIDPAGQGEDLHSMSILDCQTGEQVLDFTSKDSVGDYAMKAYRFGTQYQFPLLGIEANGVGLAMIEAIKGLGWPDNKLIYQDEKRTKPGVVASQVSRDRNLVDLAEGVRQGAIIPYSRATLDEMFSFVKNPKGRPTAAPGAHDDRVMALAWANWCSKQAPVSRVIRSESLNYARTTN